MMRGRNQILKNTGLFEGIEDHEMDVVLRCLEAFTCKYARDEFVFRRGDRTDFLGVILSGKVREVREDWWGNRTVLADFTGGDTICTDYACMSDHLDVSVVATEPTEIMFLDVGRVTNVCTSSCQFHNRLVKNLIRSLAGISLSMNRRLDQLSKRSTREKVCAFLSDQARVAGSCKFVISMNRQEMADYLGVDRSAMSSELGKMQRDGIIEFRRNHFVLKRSPAPVSLSHELVQESRRMVVAGGGHAFGHVRVHHVPQ